MVDPTAIAIAGVTGLLSGFVLSIPVGPVNLTIMSEGARRGFLYALMIGLGASLMETFYCGIAFTGFADFFEQGMVKAAMVVASFIFMVFLGLKFLTASSVASSTKVEQQIAAKVKPHSAFMVGFVRVLGNPGVLLFWIFLSANLVSHGLVKPSPYCKWVCIIGVTLGTSLWFSGLSWAVSLGHKKLSEKTLLRMERGSGLVLLVFGLVQGGQIAMELARARHIPF
jgi:threonine/homoserine/homoserine lactone efflux protein